MEDQDKIKTDAEKEKERIILGIETRIRSEYIKHGRNIDDWAKIAAYKIYATYEVKLKDPDTL